MAVLFREQPLIKTFILESKHIGPSSIIRLRRFGDGKQRYTFLFQSRSSDANFESKFLRIVEHDPR